MGWGSCGCGWPWVSSRSYSYRRFQPSDLSSPYPLLIPPQLRHAAGRFPRPSPFSSPPSSSLSFPLAETHRHARLSLLYPLPSAPSVARAHKRKRSVTNSGSPAGLFCTVQWMTNILNQSAANGNGHSVFSAPRGPSPSSARHHHQDACPHLRPVALHLPPTSANTLRSMQLSRPPIVDENGGEPLIFHRADGVNPLAVKAQGRQMGGAGVGPLEDICKLSHLHGGGGGEDHFKFPADPTTAPYHLSCRVAEDGERKASGSDAGDVEFEPRSTLGFIRPLMEDSKFSQLIQEYYAVGDHLDQQLFSPEEPPSVVTLAVSVSSAVKLDSNQMDQIAKKMRRLTGFKNLRLENTVDPSLIAGFVISYGVGDAHVIDLSVKGRLAELEARLESSDQSAGAEGWNFPTSGGDGSY